MNRLLLASLHLLLAAALCCTPLSHGRDYAIAKVDRDGYLVDPDSPSDPSEEPHDRIARGTLEIRLADYHLEYLDSPGAPDIALFARTTLTDSSGVPHTVERVLLNTADGFGAFATGPGTGGNLRGVPILPETSYDGGAVHLSLRIVELDADDNARMRAWLGTAANAASAARPDATPAISLAQIALSQLIAHNTDDIEFAIDLGLRGGHGASPLPQLHVGHLAIVKTEHPGRTVLPPSWLARGTQGARWLLASALQLVTLDAANLWNDDRSYDRYARLLGDPFRVSHDSQTLPVISADGFLCHRTFTPLVASNAGKLHRLRWRGRQLVAEPYSENANAPAAGGERFHAKSYVVLSIDSPSSRQ